jgi:hypothetical protein
MVLNFETLDDPHPSKLCLLEDGQQGYLYVMFNPCYKNYDPNFYKCGRTKNLNQRIKGYQTPFKDKSVYLFTSNLFDNCIAAEYVLFCLLKKYRVHPKREFFIYPLQDIINTIRLLEEVDSFELYELYKKLKSTAYTSWILKRFFNESEIKVDLYTDELDEHFSQFLFRPSNPEIYYKYGYRENWRKDREDIIEKKLEEKIKL